MGRDSRVNQITQTLALAFTHQLSHRGTVITSSSVAAAGVLEVAALYSSVSLIPPLPAILLSLLTMSLAAFLPPPRYASLEPDSPPASPPLLASKPATSSPSHAVTSLSLLTAVPSTAASSLSLLLHSSSATAPVQRDSDGSVRYDAIVRQGRAAGVTVQTSYGDMAAKRVTADELVRPSVEEEAKAVDETRRALGLAVERRLAHSSTTYVRPHSNEASFIRYTPSASSVHHNSGAFSRLIRLTEAPVDPLQPMLLKHQKLPASVPDAPVPLMHSPPRKLTAEDVAAWKIPPCIPNWKNSKGYTIALDKRMASDGRGLQTVEVSDKFAQLSESLFVAERLAREEIEQRANIRHGVRRKEKEEKEDELRRLAEEARRSLAVAKQDDDGRDAATPSESYQAAGDSRVKGEQYEDGDDEAGRRERDEVRRDRQSELKRSLLQQRQKESMKGGKISSVRDDERDISEKIALGQAAPSTAASAMPFDSRLFNQTEGLSGGFHGDDTYSIYDRPLFQASGAGTGQYRPTATSVGDAAHEEEGGERGKADKPFQGTEGSSGGGRVRPVEFEREGDADPFGLGSLLNEASRSAEEERKERERDSYRDDDDRDTSSGQRRRARWQEEEKDDRQRTDNSERDRRPRGGDGDGGDNSQRGERRTTRSRSGSPDRRRERQHEDRGDKRRRF